MDVKYRLGDEQTDAAILTDFPNVYHRICRLADHLMGYYLRGDALLFIPATASREGVPRFVSAVFDERSAQRFEERVRKAISRKRYPRELPVPAFPIRLEVEFAEGGREAFTFDFRDRSDEALIAFCRAVCESARRHFRMRFSAKNSPT